MSADQALEDRIEIPSIPHEAQKQIAHLQEEFARAEVVQSELQPFDPFDPSIPKSRISFLCTKDDSV